MPLLETRPALLQATTLTLHKGKTQLTEKAERVNHIYQLVRVRFSISESLQKIRRVMAGVVLGARMKGSYENTTKLYVCALIKIYLLNYITIMQG